MKIAGVQMDVSLGDVAANLERMASIIRETTQAGAELVIFPECAATGYCFSSAEEAREFAEPVPGPITTAVSNACRDHGCFVVFGMLTEQ